MKSNHIYRVLIPLEKLFDQNDVSMDPKVKHVEDKNIGTKDNPKIVRLSKKLPAKEKD